MTVGWVQGGDFRVRRAMRRPKGHQPLLTCLLVCAYFFLSGLGDVYRHVADARIGADRHHSLTCILFSFFAPQGAGPHHDEAAETSTAWRTEGSVATGTGYWTVAAGWQLSSALKPWFCSPAIWLPGRRALAPAMARVPSRLVPLTSLARAPPVRA